MKFLPVIIAAVLALIARSFLISVYKVPTQTMAPTILAGDYILASQLPQAPVPGSLIVFVKSNRPFIKRVIAVEGQSVEIKGGELIVSGQKCDYTALSADLEAQIFTESCGLLQRSILQPPEAAKSRLNLTQTPVQKDEYFVIGDNRNIENNLTSGELVKADQIVGKPLIVWMSYTSTQDFISKVSGVRWNRILTIPR